MIKYIGSKRVLLPTILGLVARLPRVRSVLDLFSGTSRVGHALKALGLRVSANDHTAYAYKLAQCYVAACRTEIGDDAARLIHELNALPGAPGYFTETFCERSRYLQPHNGARVDAIRERIAQLALDPLREAVLLVSLMEAADRVDSTCGLQMAYLKRWSARSHNPLTLRMPDVLPGVGSAHQLEARAAAQLGGHDLVYLDPPYNQHRYLGNYHVWESLVRWDKPEVYGTAMKRVDCRTYKSDFNSRRRIASALGEVVHALDARYLLVSFNNEGYLGREAMMALLGARGEVACLEVAHRRYVGAQIGIYNPRGEKVGRVSHLVNRECFFLVGEDAHAIVRALQPEPAPEAAADDAPAVPVSAALD
ncbi:MAG: DNA adenine methylase [Polyangiales bacterium]